jgi:hypothetical protein
MQREVCKYVEPLIGIQLATGSCIKRRRRLVFRFLLTIVARKLITCCQQVLLLGIKIGYCLGFSSASPEGI